MCGCSGAGGHAGSAGHWSCGYTGPADVEMCGYAGQFEVSRSPIREWQGGKGIAVRETHGIQLVR